MNRKADEKLAMDQLEILRELGRGGTSVVCLVKSKKDGCLYAMKILGKNVPDRTEEAFTEAEEQLRAEGEVLRALGKAGERDDCTDMEQGIRGKGIPSFRGEIYDEGGFYAGFLMEYVKGQTLKELLEDGWACSVRETAEAGLQLCAVMKRLHRQEPPMIYRDLKPANIIARPDGSLVVVDYGAVRKYRKRAAGDTDHLGTEGYAAPEQYGGWEQTDERTDIYGIGAVMHHMLTGRSPLDTGLRPLNEIPGISGDDPACLAMGKVLLRCCMTAPSMRYSSCGELEKALDGVLQLCREKEKNAEKKKTGEGEKNSAKNTEADLTGAKEGAWKKFVALSCAAVVFMACSGFFAAASSKAERTEYQALIAEAGRESNPEKMAEGFARAVRMRPEDPEAYICLARELVRDYVITREEKEMLDAFLLEEDRLERMKENSPGNYARLEIELGKAFFACYEGGTGQAGAFFKKAREAAGIRFDGRKTAEAMETVLGEEWGQDRITAWRVLEQESVREAEESGSGVFATAVCKAAASEISLYTDRYEKAGTEETAIREVTENAEKFVTEIENGRVRVPEKLFEELKAAVESAARGKNRQERRTAEKTEKTPSGEAEQEHK